MKPIEYLSRREQETFNLGKNLAHYLKSADVICLIGDLGTGKTTFTKGIAQGLKIISTQVNSPTFVLLNIYEGKLPVYHLDLYRMEDTKEILNIGYEEFLYGQGVAVVEWAERLKKLLPNEYLEVRFKHKARNERLLKFTARGQRYEALLRKMIHHNN